ncbi:MAG: transketolase [Anaerolineae bacterium]|nr:transketolase [Anaerolineae bacterium]
MAAKITPNLDQMCVNTIRFLAADAVEKAQSGHAGTPMGAAPIAYVLWSRFLKHSPRQPDWVNRDRFILSSGHASMMLYALLHLTGYELSLAELKNFRQWGSLTPGHPEYRHTPGVEITTGPLGQGFANAVGIAMAEAHLAARYNMPGLPPIVDHHTYVLASDGDLMEGVASEAASLAGHLCLGRLICLYDDNHVTIEGFTALAFTEDRVARFQAYGWHVQRIADANDLQSVAAAIEAAQAVTDRPSLIAIQSTIGYGSPSKQGTSAAHSGALGVEDLLAAKKNLGWPVTEPFHVPIEVREHFQAAVEMGRKQVAEWQSRFDNYRENYPSEAAEFERIMRGELPPDWEDHLPTFEANTHGIATRKVNAPLINSLAPVISELMGGSADLAPSNITLIESSEDFAAGCYQGRNLRFGVREHAMGSIINGLAVHGGVLPYGATYFTFYDYMRPAVRLGAMMKLRIIYVFTHDSIAVGEDGPTHQPVEQLFGLRSVPNLTVIRPCDANEASEAWRLAILNSQGPTCLVLSRQNLPVLDRQTYAPAYGVQKGAYVLSEAEGGQPGLILIATGSEVHVALKAQSQLATMGLKTRVVSMPSWELFARQPQSYKDNVLPPDVKARLAIEAGSTLGWERWVGQEGAIIGLDRFGISAPYQKLLEELGFTGENVVKIALELVGKSY